MPCAMELHLMNPANLPYLSTHSCKSTKCFTLKSSKRDSLIVPLKGIQRCSHKDLSRILRKEAAVRNIEKKANSNKYNNLSPKAVLDALDEAIRGNQWESALKIEKMESWFDQFQLMGVKPDIMTFNILIKSYGKAAMYGKMGSVLDFMKKRFHSPTTVTYNTVIDTFGKAGDVEKMEEFFLKMKHQGMKPNSITYCSLANAYSKSGLLDRVESLWRQIENSDVVLDTPFFNCIIRAYGQAGDVQRMVEFFMAMEDRKCKPDDLTFASMIQAYHAQGMTEAAQNLERMMVTTRDTSRTLFIVSQKQ